MTWEQRSRRREESDAVKDEEDDDESAGSDEEVRQRRMKWGQGRMGRVGARRTMCRHRQRGRGAKGGAWKGCRRSQGDGGRAGRPSWGARAAVERLEVLLAVANFLYKLVLNDGMKSTILVAYRYLFAASFMVPLAFFWERKKRTKMTWKVLMLSFLSGLFGGTLSQHLYLSCIHLTSATFATAMLNITPAITFILAVIFRLESLAIQTVSTQAKIIGTLVGIGGAMILTFYKGIAFSFGTTHINLLQYLHNAGQDHPQHDSSNHAIGSLFGVLTCVSWSIFLIIQAKMNEEYPFHYSSIALLCVMAATQSTVFALCVEKNVMSWRLRFDIRLLTVFYSGVLASGLVFIVMSWCIMKKGPLFASVFSPLMLVVVAILSSFLLVEKMHLGSVVGAAVIVVGLYIVLWGKGKEEAKMNSSSSIHIIIDASNTETTGLQEREKSISMINGNSEELKPSK
ncbi:WAT1-related protein [Canna indica]|uniref:WAT1-related protein n=1 Tax=Canna indica TaxID=4628 RepID=A0AAQ3QM60_9LILI|nr:WAT1-related protein [Canna indica]